MQEELVYVLMEGPILANVVMEHFRLRGISHFKNTTE